MFMNDDQALAEDHTSVAASPQERIAQAQARIAAAFERVEGTIDAFSLWALEQMTAPKVDEGALQAAEVGRVEAETRLALQTSKSRQRIDELEAKLVAQSERLGAIGDELQSLRDSNSELRSLTEAMRSSLEAQIEDPSLVNRALEAELAALQVTRAADLAEVTAAIAELKPFVEERL